MAAAQVAGTPAAAPVAAVEAPIGNDSSDIGLEAALAAYVAPEEPTDASAETAEAPAAVDAAPGAAADPLSAEALAAPGGIAKAQAFLKEKQREHDRAYLKLDRREKALKTDVERWKGELGQSRAYVQAVQGDLALLASGTAEQKLEALGRLSRKDGLAAWEELAISAASNGKKAPETAAERAIRQELEQLKNQLANKDLAEREHAAGFQLRQLQTQLHQGATDAAQYPALAQFAAQKPAEVVAALQEIIAEAHTAGGDVRWTTAYAKPNEQLAPYIQAAPAAVAMKVAGGLATSAPQGAKPVVPTQRSPGRSLNPSLATQAGGAVREMTDAERMAELASDPDFISSLF